MLGSFTKETFAPHVGEAFIVRLPNMEPVELRLETVQGLRAESSAGTRDPFSIHFRGPSGFILPQQIYTLEHDRLGSLELFIVPIGKDASGTLYEAIFT